MTDRFEQEFYPSPWRRVLPLGPDGIQPYVRPGRGPGARDLRRLGASIGGALERIAAFVGRVGTSGRPVLERGPARRQRLAAARSGGPRRATPQLRRAA